MAIAVLLFAGALAVIASERVDRTKVALLGAVLLLLLTQTIDQHAAIEAVDWNTLGLLVGMMLMVKITEPTGVFTWLAIRAGQISRGRPLAVVLSLAITTAVLSAFLDNLTTVLLMVPITFLLADVLDIDPIPLVIIEILVGLYLLYRRRLQIAPKARAHVMDLDATRSIEDPDELKRTVPILVGTILVFFAHQALHLEPATVALSGATLMLLISRQPLERSLGGIEWPTLFFVIGLFRDGRRA
jgi:Na+/H+ antiporter NhaD/arsenite permease-like protein